MTVKVWLGGEGLSELGRADAPGVIEALLRSVEASGWQVAGVTAWKDIVKLRVGAGLRGGENHLDLRNALGMINQAHEARCEVVAFVRDTDGQPDVAAAVAKGIELAPQVIELLYAIGIIGGVAAPTLEAWLLALHHIPNSQEMSKPRLRREFEERALPWKDVEAYVEMVEAWDQQLPVGCDSLRIWLATAATVLAAAIHGASLRSPR